ncbi:MAG TPA: DUF6519 domain-containing protein [Chthoniobacterales bacterium]|nr:DUF6519 domain-containing protein [Chthoniobacterales bacterium]
MRGDFSRETFNPASHYNGVLQQQGRVQLDADWNEAEAIARHRDQTTVKDVVGVTGAPRVEPGFRVSTTGANLQISRGHFYVDGILCQNEQDVPFTAQPDLPGEPLPPADGVYLAYLEVWERHLGPAEAPELRETALGGADTTTRLQTVCQVKLLPLPNTGVNATCTGNIPEWTTLLAHADPSPAQIGQMRARTAPEGVTLNPACVLPPSAGFKGLENQLYRVEIHHGGTRDVASFKWSRENGSVVARINNVNGQDLEVDDVRKDDKLAFVNQPWVELSDSVLDLRQQRGELFQVGNVDPGLRKITLTGGPPTALDPQRSRIVRRWEQSGALAGANGVALNAADWITLEDGIQVQFKPGIYKTGDYWLIPARSAVNIETGRVEWPQDTSVAPPVPAARPPQGNKHHFARLGLFRQQGGNWSALAGTGDCRIVFPPLTQLTARDVGFDNTVCDFDPAAGTVQDALDRLCRTRHCSCTILIAPGDDLAAAFAKLGPAQNAMICFQAGDYRIRDTVVIANKGHLRLTGCGPGTRLFSSKSECVLRFSRCQSVSVEHLSVGGGNTNMKKLNGALTFESCNSVSVQNATLACRGFGSRRVTCLTVHNAVSARIGGCDFSTGHLQTGILLSNVSRSFVSDNILRAGHRPPSSQLLQDKGYRARLRRNLISNGILGPLSQDIGRMTNATVTVGRHTVHFRTDPSLTNAANRNSNEWVLALAGRTSVASPRALYSLLKAKADRALLNIATVGMPVTIPNLAEQALTEDSAAGGQGIVIGGAQAEEVHIVANSIQSFVQGVHVGLSRSDNPPDTADSAGQVVIVRNRVRIRIGTVSRRERHGIFVGNFESLEVQGNRVQGLRTKLGQDIFSEAIRVYGAAGPRMVICDNDLDGFNVGIAFVTKVVPKVRLWLITGNLAQNAAQGVLAHRRTGQHLSAIRNLIRGVSENENVP